ncbi:MAG TPA: hypothetical protein VG826_07025 [Pirellulales bacterium]|nr:hypothetical protein [Pirellulales bacterium]
MERKSARSVAVVLAAVFGLIAAYPLSVGPAAFLSQYLDLGPLTQPISDGLQVFYSPLFQLPDPIGRWIDLWWNYGTDLGAELY